MKKLSKEKILLPIAGIASLLSLSYIYIYNEKNNNLNNNPVTTLNENLDINNKNAAGTYQGDTLTAEAVKTLGWNTKENITLADWASAPNVVFIAKIPTSQSGNFSPFENSKIKSIQIPKRIKELRPFAFAYLGTLTSVTFEKGSELTLIGEQAFITTALVSIEIPSGVTEIGIRVFNLCTSLKNINFEVNSKLESIGERAFEQASLTKLDLPNSLMTIGPQAFEHLESTLIGSQISMPIRFQTMHPFNYYGFELEQWNLIKWKVDNFHDAILTKQAIASLGWNNKRTITLQDWQTQAPNVTQIGTDKDPSDMGVFSGNSVLESIAIPDKITTIGNFAFSGANKLSTVTLSNNSSLTLIGTSSFQNSKLVSINIPSGVTSIGNLAFQSSSLSTINFATNSKLTSIGISAFQATQLLSINVPDSVESIGVNAFNQTAATLNGNQVSMPIKLKLGSSSFLYGFTQNQWDAIVWRIVPFNETILTKEAVESIGWNVESTITLADWERLAPNVTQIGILGSPSKAVSGPFQDNKFLRLIEIPEKVTIIGDLAFQNSVITSITIPKSVTKIGNDTFNTTASLNEIKMPYNDQLFDINNTSKPLFGFIGEQWNSIDWQGVPTGNVTINSIIARHLLKQDSIVTWNEISSYNGIEAQAFKGTEITALTIHYKDNFTIGNDAFLDTNQLSDITISDMYKEASKNYGFSSIQQERIKFVTSPSGDNIGIIAGSISGVVAIFAIAGGALWFIKHTKKKHAYDTYETNMGSEVYQDDWSYEESSEYNDDDEYADYEEPEYDNYEEPTEYYEEEAEEYDDYEEPTEYYEDEIEEYDDYEEPVESYEEYEEIDEEAYDEDEESSK